MANKRMFSKQITTSDAFVDMPATSQLLYFHLNMEADDDGFVANPKRIMRMLGAGTDDLKLLLAKRFLLAFESGVVVIKHWLLHNAVRKDMYKETQYLEEKKKLKIKDNGAYTELRNESVTSPLHRLGQDRIGKVRLDKNNPAEKSAAGGAKDKINEIIHYFFEEKGWQYEQSPASQKLFRRYLRPAQELLDLCEGNISEAKECIQKIATWAKSRNLEWSIETVFKRWYDLDSLKPKEKKPHYDGCRIFQRNAPEGRWYIIRNGEIKELGFWPKQEQISYA